MASASSLHSLISKIYSAGVEAVRPASLVRQALKIESITDTLHVDGRQYQLKRNVVVVGFGKAVFGMTVALHSLLRDHIQRGIISVPVGTLQQVTQSQDVQSFLTDTKIKVVEGASYNLPDAPAERAAREILSLVQEASDGELIVALVSGGGSSLLPVPERGIKLDEKRKTVEVLSAAGATINELNVVRQCLSQVKGGKLAAKAYPAQLLGLILSDIVNDPLDYIASGPTIPQCPDDNLALEIIKKYGKMDSLPEPVPSHLSWLQSAGSSHTPPATSHIHNVLIGNNSTATRAAQEEAESHGCRAITWSHAVQGEARDIGHLYAEIASDVMNGNLQTSDAPKRTSTLIDALSVSVPSHDIERLYNGIASLNDSSDRVCIISGGEPTVTLHGNGKGGRNQELALSFAKHMDRLANLKSEETVQQQKQRRRKVIFCSVGTDGQDGPTDAAGAIVDDKTWSRALTQGLDPDLFLKRNDSYNFFSSAEGEFHIKLGLTGTNVMDLHILLIE